MLYRCYKNSPKSVDILCVINYNFEEMKNDEMKFFIADE